jgi:hypothetical protein
MTAMDGGSAGFAGAINLSASILGQPPRKMTNSYPDKLFISDY